MASRNKVIDYLAYLAVRVATMFAHLLGWRACYAAAAAAGNMMHRFDRRHRERTEDHVRASFPELSERRVREIARASMRHMGYLAVDVLLTPRLLHQYTWRRYVRLTGMDEAMRMRLGDERGAVVVSGHFGGWEVFGHAAALLGFPGYALARRLDNPYLNDYLFGLRERAGMRILDKHGAMRRMDELIARGEMVGFVADQDAGQRGLFVDFFGRPASTYKAPGLTAMRYDVPIFVVFARRIGERFRFELGVQRIIRPDQWHHRDDPLRWITQEYTAALEAAIRTAPEQYLWIYRRWKTQPRQKRKPQADD